MAQYKYIVNIVNIEYLCYGSKAYFFNAKENEIPARLVH